MGQNEWKSSSLPWDSGLCAPGGEPGTGHKTLATIIRNLPPPADQPVPLVDRPPVNYYFHVILKHARGRGDSVKQSPGLPSRDHSM